MPESCAYEQAVEAGEIAVFRLVYNREPITNALGRIVQSDAHLLGAIRERFVAGLDVAAPILQQQAREQVGVVLQKRYEEAERRFKEQSENEPDRSFHGGELQALNTLYQDLFIGEGGSKYEHVSVVESIKQQAREELLAQLAECYRLTGAEPAGVDSMDADHAVEEVRRLRQEHDALVDAVSTLTTPETAEGIFRAAESATSSLGEEGS